MTNKHDMVWDKILDVLILLKVDEVIDNTEFKWLKEDIELVVSDLEERE
jgi:hypothetical protein